MTTRRITSQINNLQTRQIVNSEKNSLLGDSELGETVFDNVRIRGHLYVDGDQTVTEIQTLHVEDPTLDLAHGATTQAGTDGAGFTVTDSDALFDRGLVPKFTYDAFSDTFKVSRPIRETLGHDSDGAFDSDDYMTVGYLNRNGDTVVRARLDSESAEIRILRSDVDANDADITGIRARLDSDSGEIQRLSIEVAALSGVSVAGLNARLDSDEAEIQRIKTDFLGRFDSDSTTLSDHSGRITTLELDQFDSDMIVNMFNEHSLISTSADSDALVGVFEKIIRDLEIRDVNNDVQFALFKSNTNF